MKKQALKHAPTIERLESASGSEPRVDRTGGRYGAGIIRGVSLCSRGEALGHYMWIDGVMLQQIAEADTNGKALKSRFTHPDMCSDGMGKGLGTIEERVLVGDQVYGDLHFYESAHNAPDGNLADYVMSLAEEDPDNFGLSIVFAHDWQAEDAFEDEHTQDIELSDDSGTVTASTRQFVSPDPLNVEHLPHARLAELHAADVVDEPAANPKGLFHRPNALLAEGEQMIDFLLGRSTKAPALSAFGADIAPERLREFVSKHLAKAGLSLTSKESEMALKTKKLAEGDEEKPKDESPKDESPKDEKPPADDKPKDEAPLADEPPKDEKPKDDEKDADEKPKAACANKGGDLAQFCEAFGHEQGAKYFLDPTVSFTGAMSQEITRLRGELTSAHDKLAAFAKSGIDPIQFSAAKDKERDKTNTTSAKSEVDNRAAFAALNSATA